jgi:Alpha/beta hydrolase domain
VHAGAGVYDAFLVHSRGVAAEPLDDCAPPTRPTPVRTDLDTPVLQFETETDLFGFLQFAAARQDDGDSVRTWEVAGTAHADHAMLDYGAASLRRWAGDGVDLTMGCTTVNDGPQAPVLRAALRALGAWVDGEVPAAAPRLAVADGAIARDGHGIARGGVRTPAVDAPTHVLSGEPRPGGALLWLLFGDSAPLGPATLATLYPTHDDYVAAVRASAGDAAGADFLLAADRDALVSAADRAAAPP